MGSQILRDRLKVALMLNAVPVFPFIFNFYALVVKERNKPAGKGSTVEVRFRFGYQ